MLRQKEHSPADQPSIFAQTFHSPSESPETHPPPTNPFWLTRLLDLGLIGIGLLGLTFCSYLMFRHGVTVVYGLGLLASVFPLACIRLTVSQKSNVMLLVMGILVPLYGTEAVVSFLAPDDLDRTGEGYIASGWMRLNATDKLVRRHSWQRDEISLSIPETKSMWCETFGEAASTPFRLFRFHRYSEQR